MKYEDIEKVNQEMATVPIKGKEYPVVTEKVKAFRKLFPNGSIETELLKCDNGICIFKAKVFNEEGNLISTGFAQEKENSSFINKTSYIENCETSAVGRALSFAGLGGDVSIASAEEVANAMNNQEISPEDFKNTMVSGKKHKGKTYQQVLEEDEQYLEWMLGNTQDENLKNNLCKLLGKEVLTPEQEKEKLSLMNEMNNLIVDTDVDLADLLIHYNVKSTKDLTLGQVRDAIQRMKK